jgi:hypothetical protein
MMIGRWWDSATPDAFASLIGCLRKIIVDMIEVDELLESAHTEQ